VVATHHSTLRSPASRASGQARPGTHQYPSVAALPGAGERTFCGRPNRTPLAFARSRPSPVRARISSRSNSARPPSTVIDCRYEPVRPAATMARTRYAGLWLRRNCCGRIRRRLAGRHHAKAVAVVGRVELRNLIASIPPGCGRRSPRARATASAPHHSALRQHQVLRGRRSALSSHESVVAVP
jgi:hypothetical protein